ncbi:MAG TPA: lipopolysaccharide kinase InaA family protein [Candidatus Kapabacteria bacterium]|nr:lipopolysaccharide kinase InaA family protein [Candidatus Kapabacteria bacterium]
MEVKVSKLFSSLENQLQEIIINYDQKGIVLVDGERNKIKLFDFEGIKINIKSFKKPNFINSIIYKFFRKSKAKRSFENATFLLENKIGTPQPIAYFENFTFFGLRKSFYVCEHLVSDLIFRELVENPNYPDSENILRQFTQFSFDLHEKGIEFLDHSPGNTLIKKVSEKQYEFFLVDLNRMNFHHSMSFEMRMKNLCRLTPHKDMIEIMANEYAKLYGISEEKTFSTLLELTTNFQERFYRKRRLKKRFMFWK